MSQSESAERSQYLSFSLAGVDYAVGILGVREILQFDGTTRVPSVPSYVRGVINLRGAVVPVVDLAVKLGLAETAVTKRTCVVIVETSLGGERAIMGIVADTVSEVLDLAPADVEPAPAFGADVRVEYLVGMAKVGKGFVLLIDLDEVLTAGEHDARPRGGPRGAAA